MQVFVFGQSARRFTMDVFACEVMQGFFRRSIQQKIQYRPCTRSQECLIVRNNRNRCQYCRLKKCIMVGMSRDGLKKHGRILRCHDKGGNRVLADHLDGTG
ncbi:zinc finger, C4 type [Cooperia oncophora]